MVLSKAHGNSLLTELSFYPFLHRPTKMAEQLVLFTVDLLSVALKKMELLEDGKEKDESEKASKPDMLKLLFLSRTHRKLPVGLAGAVLAAAAKRKDLSGSNAVATALLRLGCSSKKKREVPVHRMALDAFDTLAGTGEKMESIALDIFADSDPESKV